MSCCCADGVRVSKMALELKSGQMLYHKRRIFGRNWREVYVVLYNDSTLAWYRDKGQMEQEGGLVIKEAPELLAYGQFTSMIPNMPEIPDNYTQKELIAFGVRGRDDVYWFLCPTEQEVESWMTAISNTLPPPPNSQPQQAYAQRPASSAALPEEYHQSPQDDPAMLPSAPQPPPPSYMQHPAPVAIPGQYPTPTAFRPPYTAPSFQPAYPYANNAPQGRLMQPMQPTGGANTTVVVQDSRRNDGGGDFAMGMLMGGAIGTQLGHGWGHGYGWGWGGGHGGAWHHSGPSIQDNDVTINNYYDVDHTVVNNDVDIDASRDMTLIADDMDFGGGDFGGGDFDVGDLGGF